MNLKAVGLAVIAAVAPTPLELPGADGPVGFDDLRFSVELRKVLVPAGRTGRVDLVDPQTHTVEEIAGFSSSRAGHRGHGESTTSADSGDGLIFASDRTKQAVVVADPRARRIVARAKLGAAPDYVRWIAPTREVWVTEPGAKIIETFRVQGTPPRLERVGVIPIPDGPESLEVDPGARRAYTNTWHGATIAIDLDSRRAVARFENGCTGARGLSVDTRRGLVFVGCEEGEAVVLDAARDGRVVGRAPAGDGVDVIAYSAGLSHLYVPGAGAGDLTVMAVLGTGGLEVLGRIPTAMNAHCVTADDLGNVYVCDPARGR